LLQKRTDSAANNISFISGWNDHGDTDRIDVRILQRNRRNGWINAPKAAARQHEIGPDQKAENSGSYEHFRYCTAHLHFQRNTFDSCAWIHAPGHAR
jgi:hypothetical protein